MRTRALENAAQDKCQIRFSESNVGCLWAHARRVWVFLAARKLQVSISDHGMSGAKVPAHPGANWARRTSGAALSLLPLHALK